LCNDNSLSKKNEVLSIHNLECVVSKYVWGVKSFSELDSEIRIKELTESVFNNGPIPQLSVQVGGFAEPAEPQNIFINLAL
jgi:hypothetical protein